MALDSKEPHTSGNIQSALPGAYWMVHASTTARECIACSVHSAELCLLLPRILSLLAKHLVRIPSSSGNAETDPSTSYPETKVQLTRYISDRAGILSIANVPIFWLFATRNDPLLWLTGWSFATYNRFHRWVARVSTIQAIVHSIGYSIFMYYQGSGAYEAEWKYQYWWTGGVVRISSIFRAEFEMLIISRQPSLCLCLWCSPCILFAETTMTSSWQCISCLH
jgi:hypothetical protein